MSQYKDLLRKHDRLELIDFNLWEILKIYFLLVISNKTPIRITMEMMLKKIVNKYNLKGFNKGLNIGGWKKDFNKRKKEFSIKNYFVANISKSLNPDILFDAISDYPFKNNSWDLVFSFNLIEHLKDPKKHISEVSRILKRKGIFLVYVPFSMFYHPDPHDYWRFTHEGLKEKFSKYFDDFFIIPIGIGMFIVGEQNRLVIYNKIPIIKYVLRALVFGIVLSLDTFLLYLSKILKKKPLYMVHPLGYLIVCRKR